MAFVGAMLVGGNFGHPYGGMMYHVNPISTISYQPATSVSTVKTHASAVQQVDTEPSNSDEPTMRSSEIRYCDEHPCDVRIRADSCFVSNLAEQWAAQEGFNQDQLTEFRHLMKMALTNYIPKNKLEGSVQIDKGSFGKIYRCNYDGTDVAVKEIGQSSSGQCNLKTKMRELLLELRVLVQIRHPNLVGFWGAAVEFPTALNRQPSMSLVFELCENSSLHNVIFENSERKVTINVAQKVKIGMQVAVGLAYLHSKFIIHRDLNTRNILLSSDMTAKIADFGCARILNEQTGTIKTTTILGSPAYMPPEQMQGHDLTEGVDIWALSMLLWEMLMETKPWEGIYSDFNSLKDAVLRGERVPMPPSTGVYPEAYHSMMRAGMSLLPQDRPTASKMHRVLQAAYNDMRAHR